MLTHYRYTQDYPALSSYLGQLPAERQEVYLAGSVFLLEAYQREHYPQELAQLLRAVRQRVGSSDPLLSVYLDYVEAVRQLRPLGFPRPGQPLPADGLNLLRRAARSGTAVARRACQTLRFYEPTCTCVLEAQPTTGAAQALATRPRAQAWPGTAYPNPAADQLHVPYRLPTGAAGTLVLTDALGRRVLTQAVSAASGEATLAVAALPAGLYSCSLLSANGQRLATQRIAITR